MKKPNNIRNAGRKLIPDSVRINRLIPRENLQEVDDFIKSIQDAAILREELKKEQTKK